MTGAELNRRLTAISEAANDAETLRGLPDAELLFLFGDRLLACQVAADGDGVEPFLRAEGAYDRAHHEILRRMGYRTQRRLVGGAALSPMTAAKLRRRIRELADDVRGEAMRRRSWLVDQGIDLAAGDERHPSLRHLRQLETDLGVLHAEEKRIGTASEGDR